MKHKDVLADTFEAIQSLPANCIGLDCYDSDGNHWTPDKPITREGLEMLIATCGWTFTRWTLEGEEELMNESEKQWAEAYDRMLYVENPAINALFPKPERIEYPPDERTRMQKFKYWFAGKILSLMAVDLRIVEWTDEAIEKVHDLYRVNAPPRPISHYAKGPEINQRGLSMPFFETQYTPVPEDKIRVTVPDSFLSNRTK